MLQYDVSVSGEAPARVFAISINRDSAGKPGPALRVLSGPGVGSTRGTVKLTDAERRDIVAGRTSLVAYTERRPLGELRAPIHQ